MDTNLFNFLIGSQDLQCRQSQRVGVLVDGNVKGDTVGDGDPTVQNVQRGHGRVQYSGAIIELFEATPNLLKNQIRFTIH